MKQLYRIEWPLVTFFWAVSTLLLTIPYAVEITTGILFISLSKINYYGELLETRTCSMGIPFFGCIFGLSFYYLFNEKAFAVEIVPNIYLKDPDVFFLILILVLILPIIGGVILAFDAYIKSDVNNFRGPIIKCFDKFSSKGIYKKSDIGTKLNIYCFVAILFMGIILFSGILVWIILSSSILLAIMSLIYILINYKRALTETILSHSRVVEIKKTVSRVSKLWGLPENDLQASITFSSNYKNNVLRVFSWLYVIPLMFLIIFVFPRNFYSLIISIPTICYILLYNIKLHKRLNCCNGRIPNLPLGNIYLFASCMLCLNLLILQGMFRLTWGLIDFPPIVTDIWVPYEYFVVMNTDFIVIFISILSAILLLLEYSNKFKNFGDFNLIPDVHKVAIGVFLSLIVFSFFMPFFLFLMFWTPVIILYYLGYYYNETDDFLKSHKVISKSLVLIIGISLGVGIIIYGPKAGLDFVVAFLLGSVCVMLGFGGISEIFILFFAFGLGIYLLTIDSGINQIDRLVLGLFCITVVFVSLLSILKNKKIIFT